MSRHFDSSITRVRPFFQPLLQRDPSGESWLGTLLRLGFANPDFGDHLAIESGPLLDWVSRPRMRTDRALRQFGIPAVELEECFEHRLPPPQAFLRWLIDNPHAMTWPAHDDLFGPTQKRREELFGHHGIAAAKFAAAEARAELDHFGAAGSNGKWWAFEGFTHVDCLLETENLLLLVEGKRMEKLSASTRWFPQRNQLLRNLEVAQAIARQKHKEYAVLMITENYVDGLSFQSIGDSLPHLPEREQSDLVNHYLGCITWSQALAAVFFPHTVEDAVNQMRAKSKLRRRGEEG